MSIACVRINPTAAPIDEEKCLQFSDCEGSSAGKPPTCVGGRLARVGRGGGAACGWGGGGGSAAEAEAGGGGSSAVAVGAGGCGVGPLSSTGPTGRGMAAPPPVLLRWPAAGVAALPSCGDGGLPRPPRRLPGAPFCSLPLPFPLPWPLVRLWERGGALPPEAAPAATVAGAGASAGTAALASAVPPLLSSPSSDVPAISLSPSSSSPAAAAGAAEDAGAGAGAAAAGATAMGAAAGSAGVVSISCSSCCCCASSTSSSLTSQSCSSCCRGFSVCRCCCCCDCCSTWSLPSAGLSCCPSFSCCSCCPCWCCCCCSWAASCFCRRVRLGPTLGFGGPAGGRFLRRPLPLPLPPLAAAPLGGLAGEDAGMGTWMPCRLRS
jgi:hypothetical protein